jgi:hypothetical protein
MYSITGAARLRWFWWWLEADSNCRPRNYEDLDEIRREPMVVRVGDDPGDLEVSILVQAGAK